MGKAKADVMPPLSPNEFWASRLNSISFWLFNATMTAITVVFFLGDILMTGRLISVGVLAIYDRLSSHVFGKPAEIAAYKPKVAVLIPAYNEEKVIERTVQGALDSDYSNLRVIVIDDGSRDRTLEVVRRAFLREEAAGKVIILTKPNGGKAEALNYGLDHIGDAEIFVGIDADTIIAPDAITRMVPHFLNPKVGAIAGNAKVGNRVNLWTRWQALEYITSQNFERRALNTLGAVSVVPGAIGAWRVSAVRAAGRFHVDTVAEDADLTMALLRSGYRVEYEDQALAFTEAPTNANALMRQRFRWSFGILQSIWKHSAVFARKGVLGFIALPNIFIFQILLPLVSPFIDIMFLVGTIWYFTRKYYHPDSTDPADFQRLVVFFVAFLIIAAQMVIALVEGFIVLSGGVLLLGFLGSPWTARFGLAYFNALIGVGTKLFMIYIIVALGGGLVTGWQATMAGGVNLAGAFSILGVSALFSFIAWSIPAYGQALASGAVSASLGGVLTSAAGIATAASAARVPLALVARASSAVNQGIALGRDRYSAGAGVLRAAGAGAGHVLASPFRAAAQNLGTRHSYRRVGAADVVRRERGL